MRNFEYMGTLIVHPENKEQLSALKAFNISFEENKHPYNTDFVEKMRISKQQAKEGKTVKISLDDIWK